LSGARLQLERVKEYVDRAQLLKLNVDESIGRGELDKAGEFLWGVVSCYLNALRLMLTGRVAADHKELMATAEQVAKNLNDERFIRAIREAERLHANFYHSFLDLQGFTQTYGEVMYALERLHGKLTEVSLSLQPR